MGILNWLFEKLDDTNTIAEQADTIAKLQQEVDALRRQEVMNLGNREEINRLHREINDLKYGPTVKKQMAEISGLMTQASPTQIEVIPLSKQVGDWC